MRKIATLISSLAFSLAIFVSPVSYEDWRDGGNSFRGGFEGFCHYFSSLNEEQMQSYIAKKEYDRMLEIPSDKDWGDKFQTVWSNGAGYSYFVR